MNLYPAMRAHMGRWEYYIVKMNMRELSESVKFAHDVYDDQTLNDAIQRELKSDRVKKHIVPYLARQEDRFFSSIVIAALGGEPQWVPVFISDDDKFALFKGDDRLNKTFGVLAFDGSQTYYALDGQHRLAAIKSLLDPEEETADSPPEGFLEEEVSVLVVVPTSLEEASDFLERYRRLFGNLNRHAKAMDKATNIIMDEDDAFAIITRRLISEHEFFRVTGRHKESFRVKTERGKNVKRTDSFFTSIEALYDMNTKLMESRERKTLGWGEEGGPDTVQFKRFRPSDESLEKLFVELKTYWDALLEELPELRNDPPMMRNHSADPERDEDPDDETTDHLLFWPIGQEMLAEIARETLDVRGPDEGVLSEGDVRAVLRGLASLEWRLHQPPWRYFLLTQDPDGDWKMRSEDRKQTVAVGRRIQEWLLGIAELDDEGIQQLKHEWAERLIPAQTDEAANEMWQVVEAQKVRA